MEIFTRSIIPERECFHILILLFLFFEISFFKTLYALPLTNEDGQYHELYNQLTKHLHAELEHIVSHYCYMLHLHNEKSNFIRLSGINMDSVSSV